MFGLLDRDVNYIMVAIKNLEEIEKAVILSSRLKTGIAILKDSSCFIILFNVYHLSGLE
jgi:hypothetical protein